MKNLYPCFIRIKYKHEFGTYELHHEDSRTSDLISRTRTSTYILFCGYRWFISILTRQNWLGTGECHGAVLEYVFVN